MAEVGEALSDRELAVLAAVVDGLTNREIARDLDISPNTVKVHLRNIFTKLGVSSRTEAATKALQEGLLGESHQDIVEKTPADPDPDQDLSSEQPGADNQDERIKAADTEPKAATAAPWRTIAVITLVIAALLAGILISSRFLVEDGESSATEAPTEDARFVEEPIEDTFWLHGLPLPRPRANMALATVGLQLYQIGGEVEAGVINLVDVYDTDSREWHSAASKPTAVADADAAVLFGEIYVPGGRLADGNPTAVVEAYSPSNDAWRPVAPLPVPLTGSVALSHGDLLYLFGGSNGQEVVPDSYVYDPSLDMWHSLPPMNNARTNAAGAALASQLFVVGGNAGEGELNTCEFFDVGQEQWQDCPAMMTPRSGAGAAVLGNKLVYIVGGGSESSVSSGEVYDARTGKWTAIDMPMISEGSSWYDLGVTNLESRIYVMGGRQNGSLVDSSYIFAPLIHQMFLPAVGTD